MTNLEEPNNTEHPVYDAPGCGLASYSCLLLCFFLLGMTGMIGSLLSLVFEEYAEKPFFLVPGNQVPVWRLQPMRDAKLLALTEVPLYYHDESQDGTTGCALTKTHLTRLDGSQHWSIPYSEIESSKVVYENKQVVTVVRTHSGELLPCFFGPTEGAERFKLYLEENLP